MTNPNTNERVSPFTSVTLSLGTGEECKENPPNLSHLSDEHLEGLLSSVHAEWKSRIISSKFSHPHKPSPRRSSSLTEKITPEVSEGSHEVSEGSLLNIGLEQGTTDNEENYINQSSKIR